jgi:hypothetical protein
MGFTKQSTKTPTSIGNLIVTLSSLANGTKSASYNVAVLDQNGGYITALTGDLLPYITQAQINALVAFMDGLRAQAMSQIIG